MARPRKSVAEKRLESEKLTKEKQEAFIDIDSELEADAVQQVEKTESEKIVEKEIFDDFIAEKEQLPKKKKQLDRNMLVRVASFVVGTLIYKSDRTGATYMFKEFGTEDEIELFEIQAMRSAYPKYLTDPWLIILDDEVVEYLGLQDLYSKLIKPDKMQKFFALSSEKIKSILKTAPKGMRDAVLAKAQLMIQSGELDSKAKISALEEVFNIDLSEI